MNKKLACLLSATSLIIGCTSPRMLPQSNAEIDYSAVGYVKDSGWHDGAVYEASEDEVFAAIRAALLANGLNIQESSRENRKFIAESPWNMHRYASYVAIYYRLQSERKIEVHVVALGTKDINVLAGDSSMPLPPIIIASIKSSLSRRAK